MGQSLYRVSSRIITIATALLLGAASGRVTAQDSAPLELLTNCQQVLELGNEGARRAPHPVRLRAVVTHPVNRRPWFYAQDATAGILVVCTNLSRQPAAGQLVEITGQAGPGLQAPHVFQADYKVIGTAPLPNPRHTTPGRLAIGEDFGQWVSLEGNVLDDLVHPEQLSLLLEEGEQHFIVNIRLSEPLAMPANWLGARVEVQGVCWTEARSDGVPTGFKIDTPGTNTIRVLRPGPTNLFDLPRSTIGSLARQPGARAERVRVAGTATFLLPDQSLFLRDDTGAIQARLLKPISAAPYLYSINEDTLFKNLPTNLAWESFARPRPYIVPVAPGDRVEVIGTPRASGTGLVLADAEYRRLGPGVAPAPVQVSNDDFQRWLREGDLVTWQGRLIDRETHQTSAGVEDLLLLRAGGATVRAFFTSAESRALPALPRNALLQITGVCCSEAGDYWEPTPVSRLRIRDPGDVTILAQPPPWESWPVGRILLLGGVLGTGALAWIALLRRRVAQHTSELAGSNTRLRAEVEQRKRAQTELSKTLAAEKELNELKSQFVSMVSHEFRTPLGVILASADLLSDYLDTLSPEERAEQVADIKESTRHMASLMEDVLLLGRVESGRMGYHPHPLDLPDFCRRIIDEMMSATSRRCPVELVEQGIDAPARGDETLLRHILHNLLANGIKYSAPGQTVRLIVERAGDEAVFMICDQGIGISTEDQKFVFEAFYRGKNIGGRPGSGLGLVVVKRCVEFHGGTIRLQSAPGEGTTVTVRLPLFRAAGDTGLRNREPAKTLPQIL